MTAPQINNTKPILLLLIPSIGSGGAERVMVHLFNHLSRDKFNIHLGVFHVREKTVDNFRDDLQNFHNLNIPRARNAYIPLLKFLRKLKPDVILSAMPALNHVLSLIRPFIGGNTKYIMRETSIPSIRKHDIPLFLYNFYYRHLAPKYDKIICQGKSMAQDLFVNYQIPREKLTIIHNPIDFQKLLTCEDSVEEFDILLVAGLRKHKGIYRFLDIVRILDDEISVGIIGEGPEKSEIELIIKKFKLYQVRMIGHLSDPIPYMKKAKVVVQTSYYEGFSNVLLESLAVGTPVIAFDVPGGTAEIINHGENGFLVEDGNINEFSTMIERALSWGWDHDKIRSEAYKRYSLDKVIGQYESVIENIL